MMRLDPFLSVINQRKLRDQGAVKRTARKQPALFAPPEPPITQRIDLPAAPPTKFEPLAELPKVSTEPPDRLPEGQGVLQGWWNQTLELVQGRNSTRELARARKVVETVRELEPRFAAMSDVELRAQTEQFRAHIKEATADELAALAEARKGLEGATHLDRQEWREAVGKAEAKLYRAEQKVLDAIMPEAFATAREAARRTTGMFPYEVQVLAGALLHRGLVAEMYTGEGKTLAAVLPAYLSALTGHGVHVATVNDYLAQRDAAEMGEIYGFLGLTTAALQSGGTQSVRAGQADARLEPVTRREAYLADITYGTATEFGFDYLRDNGVKDVSERVQRPLYAVIADEVDAILIDEARVPLIIAEGGPPPKVEELIRARDLVAQLEWKVDVEWDQEEHWVGLTEKGADKLAALMGVESIYDVGIVERERFAFINDALQARFLLRADQDYTVIDGKVVTIGKNGHAEEGRRFTHGLHQALEAKENVPVLPDTLTRASITMREYLGRYARHSGMTGTALSASDVFSKVYGLDVVRVPQRKPLIRIDHPDRVFATKGEKLRAFVEDLGKAHATGRPILVGVEWTSTAETLAEALAGQGIEARVLTAKNDAEEAEIIANAGRTGAITIVTPRGGRGVDIKLGGSEKARVEALVGEGLSKKDAIARARAECAGERAKVMAAGGLLVMGFEHMDSRRRDDQLRGRAARQGDPGATIFYTSMDDPLYDGLKEVEKLRKGETPFSEGLARTLTERALDHSEGRINDELSLSVPYDEVMAIHRMHFYNLRDDILSVPDCREVARAAIHDALDEIISNIEDSSLKPRIDDPLSEVLAKELYVALGKVLPLPEHGPPPDWTEKSPGAIRDDVWALKAALLERRDRAVGEEIGRVLERSAFIDALDEAWIQHLDLMMHIRQAIGWRAYAQKDPRQEFRREAFHEYENLLTDIRERLASRLLKTMPFINPDAAAGVAAGADGGVAGGAAGGVADGAAREAGGPSARG